ncbi:MAG: COX15/CtaA family protein [Nocardioides sp.]
MGVNPTPSRALVVTAWASLVANIVIVVTGGAVRLTASGLGCPTWPRCTEESFTPHNALTLHSAIEFGNRTLTFVLTAVAIATVVVAWRTGRRDLRGLAIVLALGIPAQAVIGGITVLTDLNPWIVSFHLLCSMAIIAGSVLYLHRIRVDPGAAWPRPRLLGWTMYAVTWAVLYLGTIVTGSGPHAGDEDAPRNGLDPETWSHLHAWMVYVLIALTLLLVVVTRARAVWWLVAAILVQGLIGFVQYYNDLPVVLVALHMLGAAVIAAASTHVLIATQPPRVIHPA